MGEIVTRREKQRRMVLFIAALLICFAGLCGIYLLSDKLKSLNAPSDPDNLSKLTENIRNLEEKQRAIILAYVDFSKTIGFGITSRDSGEPYYSTGILSQSLTSFLDKWAEILNKEYGKNYTAWTSAEHGEHLRLKNLFADLEEIYKNFVSKIDDTKHAIERFQQEEKEIYDEAKKTMEEMCSERDSKAKEIEAKSSELYSFQKDHLAKIGEIRNNLFTESLELQNVRRKNAEEVAKLEAKQKKMNERLKTLSQGIDVEREKKEPDGKVIFSDTERNIAYINLKQGDRIFVGTRFLLFSIGLGGSKTDRGIVEVVEINKDYSVIVPRELFDKKYKIQEGDCVFDEFYKKGEPKRFSVAGKLVWRLGLEELVRRLEDNGDIYQPVVQETSCRTDYIILGKGYENDPNWRRAKEFGIKPILERHIYYSLGIPR